MGVGGGGGGGGSVPEDLVMSSAVKIFTLNTAQWDTSSWDGEEDEEEEEDVLPSILAACHLSCSSVIAFLLLRFFPSDKVGQRYTSAQHAGGEGGGKDRWRRWEEVRRRS